MSTEIRSACEDHEHSNEYGKQLAATQSRLGGSKPSGAQQTQQIHVAIQRLHGPLSELRRVSTTISLQLQPLVHMGRRNRRLLLLVSRPSPIQKATRQPGMDISLR